MIEAILFTVLRRVNQHILMFRNFLNEDKIEKKYLSFQYSVNSQLGICTAPG